MLAPLLDLGDAAALCGAPVARAELAGRCRKKKERKKKEKKKEPYFKRCASDSERERHCARILRKFRENTVAPYLPYGSRL